MSEDARQKACLHFYRFAYRFAIKNVNASPLSTVDSSALPVCLQKAAKSLTEPGSVEMTCSTCPDVMSVSAFLARKMGSGQLRPFTSRALSMVVVFIIFFAYKKAVSRVIAK